MASCANATRQQAENVMQFDERQTLIILEDSQGLDVARQAMASDSASCGANVRWATHSPYVIEMLRRQGIVPVVIDEDVSQAEADAIGYAALDASRAIAGYLDARALGWPLDLRAGWPMRHVLHRALTAYFYKAFLFARLIERSDPGTRIIAVGWDQATPVSDYNVMPNRFDTLFAVLAGRMGFDVLRHKSIVPSGAMETGDYLKPTLWSRITTVLNAPIASTAYRFWSQVLGGRSIALSRRRTKLAVAIMAGNELIEDTLLSLFGLGALVFQAPQLPRGLALAYIQLDEDALAAELRRLVLQHTSALPVKVSEPFETAADEVATRIVAALRYGGAVAHALPKYIEGLRTKAESRPLAVLSNGMTSGAENLLRDALRASNISVIVAEHGVAPGLSTLHHALLERERADDNEGTIFWTQIQMDHAVEVTGLNANQALVSGAPRRLQQIGCHALQRHIVRRNLKVDRRLLAWCTGLYPNNMQFLPHYWRDSEYHRIRREVLGSVLGDLSYQVLLKLYPTYRYTDPDPLSDSAHVPANVRVEQFTDFRSLRAAADVLMIDGPGSILGWGWGSESPLIFLETGMYTLRDSVRAQFEEAIFYIDVRRFNWQSDLRALLSLPADEMRRLYALKADRRRDVGSYCILGPAGSPGRRAADYIFRKALGSDLAATININDKVRRSHSYDASKL